MQSLLIGTRKGLFVLQADASGQWPITAVHFAGEPVSQTFTDPVTGHWFAALRLVVRFTKTLP